MLSDHGFSTPLVIKNNGQLFRLCKTEKYMQELKNIVNSKKKIDYVERQIIEGGKKNFWREENRKTY